MKENHQSAEDVAFWEAGSKTFKIFISAFVLSLGLLFLVGFFTRLSYLTADDFGLLIMAILFIALGVMMFNYFLNPRVLITDSMLYVRDFWRVRRWALSEIAGVATRKEKLKPRPGTVVVPPLIEWIVLELANGRSARFIAPGFVGNDKLLALLAERLNLYVDRDNRAYEEVPLGKSPFK